LARTGFTGFILSVLIAPVLLDHDSIAPTLILLIDLIHILEKEQQAMTQVVLGENEGIESALRRFKRQVSKAGILADVKSHRHFETPLEKRKRKAVMARRKRRFR
jgi:small subunit ribosomal protein S21